MLLSTSKIRYGQQIVYDNQFNAKTDNTRKAGDVEINPVPTTTHKQVWICDIYHKQTHGKRQILIRCNIIEHWVHLICAVIRLAQYTDTWSCHLHKESRLTTHTGITPHHTSRPRSKPSTHAPPTPHAT